MRRGERSHSLATGYRSVVPMSAGTHREVQPGRCRNDVSWLAPNAIGLLASLGMSVLSLALSHWFIVIVGTLWMTRGKLIVFICKCASVPPALLIKDKSWFPQLMCLHREANAGRGFPSWLLLHYFLLDFLPCTIVCANRPWLVSGKATEKTKRELLERSNNLCFFFAMIKEVHPRLPTALWLMMSWPFSHGFNF